MLRVGSPSQMARKVLRTAWQFTRGSSTLPNQGVEIVPVQPGHHIRIDQHWKRPPTFYNEPLLLTWAQHELQGAIRQAIDATFVCPILDDIVVTMILHLEDRNWSCWNTTTKPYGRQTLSTWLLQQCGPFQCTIIRQSKQPRQVTLCFKSCHRHPELKPGVLLAKQ